nr:unnamed protein product [Callosobruchus analis]CAI5869597.1 unnamed protein product [Callosobruchus analis]
MSTVVMVSKIATTEEMKKVADATPTSSSASRITLASTAIDSVTEVQIVRTTQTKGTVLRPYLRLGTVEKTNLGVTTEPAFPRTDSATDDRIVLMERTKEDAPVAATNFLA